MRDSRRSARLAAVAAVVGLVACGSPTPQEARPVAQATDKVKLGRPGDRFWGRFARPGRTLGKGKIGQRPTEASRPAGLSPGRHTLILTVSRWLSKKGTRVFPPRCTLAPPGQEEARDGFVVGWEQIEVSGDPCYAGVSQVAVRFDDAPLRRVPNMVIDRVVLTYSEEPGRFCATKGNYCWTGGAGTPEPKPEGCVEVKIPTVDWAASEPQGMIPFATGPDPLAPFEGPSRYPSVKRLGPREWDVTQAFAWQFSPGAAPLGASPGFGFLLTGWPTLRELTAEDNMACGSIVKDVKLAATITVYKDQPLQMPR
ncbi:MAG: hypothetical protein FJZ01_01620 [Candidatus Sericytochromatia bacterium]|nr:hypothetical protein [Candidatus Tanganyikabacteria bacterium]